MTMRTTKERGPVMHNESKNVEGQASATSTLPLGQRNKNPLNIRYNKFMSWQGACAVNKGFVVFKSEVWGIRSGIIILTKYVLAHHLTTIPMIIHRWAPNGDGNNNEQAYCLAIARISGLSIIEKVQRKKEWLFLLMKAMCQVESNYDLTEAMFDRAFMKCTSMTQNFWLDKYDSFKGTAK